LAADIYVPGINLLDLLKVAEEIDFSGIGFYPLTEFFASGYPPCWTSPLAGLIINTGLKGGEKIWI